MSSAGPTGLGPFLVPILAFLVPLHPLSGAFKFPSFGTRVNKDIRKDTFVAEAFGKGG